MLLNFRLLSKEVFGANTTICTLPSSLCPDEHVTCSVVVMDAGTAIGVGHLTIQKDGRVYIATSLPGARWVIGCATYLLG